MDGMGWDGMGWDGMGWDGIMGCNRWVSGWMSGGVGWMNDSRVRYVIGQLLLWIKPFAWALHVREQWQQPMRLRHWLVVA